MSVKRKVTVPEGSSRTGEDLLRGLVERQPAARVATALELRPGLREDSIGKPSALAVPRAERALLLFGLDRAPQTPCPLELTALGCDASEPRQGEDDGDPVAELMRESQRLLYCALRVSNIATLERRVRQPPQHARSLPVEPDLASQIRALLNQLHSIGVVPQSALGFADDPEGKCFRACVIPFAR